MAPKVDQCCCGCSLRTGALLIALCHIVLSASILIATTVALCRMYGPGAKFYNTNSTSVYPDGDPGGHRKRKYEFLDTGLKAVVITATAVFSFNLFINTLLVIGVKKEKLCLVNVWIIVNSVILMVSIVVLIISLFMTFLDPEPPLDFMGLSFLSIVTTVYFMIVVNSLYHRMNRRYSVSSDLTPPIVFIIDPSPTPLSLEQDLPPPYPRSMYSNDETLVEPLNPEGKESTTAF